ncbi:tetratricopeptide repeat protein [Candidatus Protochlamydia phocaeensis]|uniref:tetratricopeptide repeat protein n=1 Tax=Candidatus Protochlamydia phocaeensis TaxID=1414722 RepID=UPI000839464A|nr:tetratricopeptide repeat protein [Candidatus Protochlamydia phocaeensis]
MTIDKNSYFFTDQSYQDASYSHRTPSNDKPSFDPSSHFAPRLVMPIGLPPMNTFLESSVPRNTSMSHHFFHIALNEVPGATQQLPAISSFEMQPKLIQSTQSVAQPILNPPPVNFNPVPLTAINVGYASVANPAISQEAESYPSAHHSINIHQQHHYSTAYSQQPYGEILRGEPINGELVWPINQARRVAEEFLDQDFNLKRELQKKIQDFCGQSYFSQFIDNPKKYSFDFSSLSKLRKDVLADLLFKWAEIKMKRNVFDLALRYFALACQMNQNLLQEERSLMTFQTIRNALNPLWIREYYQMNQQIDISYSLRRMANSFTNLNQFSMAFECFKLAYSLARGSKDLNTWKYFLFSFEKNYYQTANERKACLKAITECEPQNMDAWFKLACLYKEEGAFNEAIQTFEIVLKYDNLKYKRVHEELCQLYITLGDGEKAAQHLQASKQKTLHFHVYQPEAI